MDSTIIKNSAKTDKTVLMSRHARLPRIRSKASPRRSARKIIAQDTDSMINADADMNVKLTDASPSNMPDMFDGFAWTIKKIKFNRPITVQPEYRIMSTVLASLFFIVIAFHVPRRVRNRRRSHYPGSA
jgi:hypothetical protein